MYATKLSRWNAAGSRRAGTWSRSCPTRDPPVEWPASSHRAEHWWFFNGGMKFDSDVRRPSLTAAGAALGDPSQIL